MSNTVDLLAPRYLFENDYPGSLFSVGEILTVKDGIAEGSVSGEQGLESDIKKYPYLFRPMFWWEDRLPEQMPEYVKTDAGEIRKVIKWVDDEDGKGWLYYQYQGDPEGDLGAYPRDTTPATLQDFEQYQEQKIKRESK